MVEQPDEYPDEATLYMITNLPVLGWAGCAALLERVGELWHYPELVKHDGEHWELHTGGWSGNEDLVMALIGNPTFWGLCWQRSERGGHYYFTIKE